MKKENAVITPEFIRLFVYSLVICIGMNMLNVIVPLYTTETLGGTTAIAGLMSTVYTFSACISRPLNSYLTDRCGRRRIMILGGVLFALGAFLCGAVPAIWMLVVTRAVMGIGYSAGSTANNTASTDIIPPDRMSEGIGYFGMSQSVASALGPAVAAGVIAIVGNRLSMISVGVIGVLGIIVALFVRYEKKPGYAKPVPEGGKSGGMFEKSAIMPSVYEGLSLFFVALLMCFMTLYIVHRGFSSSTAGNFFVVSSVVIVVIRMAFSKLMNRLSVTVFLIPGYIALLAACLLLPRCTVSAHLMGMAVLFGIAHGVIWMALGSEAVRLAPPEGRGAANATFYFVFDASIGLGAAFWGTMIDRAGYDTCFRIAAIAAAVLAVACIPVFRKRGKIK